jgi:hypothetical protein
MRDSDGLQCKERKIRLFHLCDPCVLSRLSAVVAAQAALGLTVAKCLSVSQTSQTDLFDPPQKPIILQVADFHDFGLQPSAFSLSPQSGPVKASQTDLAKSKCVKPVSRACRAEAAFRRRRVSLSQSESNQFTLAKGGVSF